MTKIPYFQVALEVEKMYDFASTCSEHVDANCEKIQTFVEACGWDMDDYIVAMMSAGQLLN